MNNENHCAPVGIASVGITRDHPTQSTPVGIAARRHAINPGRDRAVGIARTPVGIAP
ncbi:MAG TPA: hypothetical protein VF469_14930 [Kofleriaceae bacterium]